MYYLIFYKMTVILNTNINNDNIIFFLYLFKYEK